MNEAPSVQPASHDADPTPGALLKRERERAALTVRQAAEDLHLDVWILEAIEANRFQALGAPVYARGHLRKYAEHLGVPVEEALARYEALQDRPQEADPIPAAMVSSLRERRRSFKGPALALLALVVIAGVVYVALDAFVLGPKPVEVVAPDVAAPDVTDPASTSTDNGTTGETSAPLVQQEASVEPSAADRSQSTESQTAAAPETSPAQAPVSDGANSPQVAAPNSPRVQVRFEFTGESWTEIYDASGARLLYGMGTPTRARTVSGVPPLQVTLGAASAVRLQVNGQTVVIPRRDGREATRFTIDADGNLR